MSFLIIAASAASYLRLLLPLGEGYSKSKITMFAVARERGAAEGTTQSAVSDPATGNIS